MKFIAKNRPPKKYADWCKKVRGKENEDYRNLHSDERDPLKQALIKEQGALCAYTLKRIDMDSCHVEHIKPESVCRAEKRGSDLDYKNMVACFPKEDLKQPYRYGAKQKDNWWEDDGKQFISPLSQRCESLLSFDIRGKIFALNNDADALKTIEILKLDHTSLTEERYRAITEFIYGADGMSPLSKAKAQTAILAILKKDRSGKFIEFCIPIKCALLQYLKQKEKIAQKRKYATQRNK